MRKHTNRLLVLFLTIMLLAGCSAVEGDTALSSYNQERTSNAALSSSEDDDSTDSKESETESSSQETAPTAPSRPIRCSTTTSQSLQKMRLRQNLLSNMPN